MLLWILMFFLPRWALCSVYWLVSESHSTSLLAESRHRLSCVFGPGDNHTPTLPHPQYKQIHSYPGPLAASRRKDDSAGSQFHDFGPKEENPALHWQRLIPWMLGKEGTLRFALLQLLITVLCPVLCCPDAPGGRTCHAAVYSQQMPSNSQLFQGGLLGRGPPGLHLAHIQWLSEGRF